MMHLTCTNMQVDMLEGARRDVGVGGGGGAVHGCMGVKR